MLPESMKDVLDAPVPYIIGLGQNVNFQDLPLDVMRVNLDTNKVLNVESLPKLPSMLYANLVAKLKAAITFSVNSQDPMLQVVDQAFNVIFIDPDEKPEFDYILVRDAMLDFMTKILYGYEKLIVLQSNQ
eukprot:TRINITY_DN601_c0_g5_i1.p4 TRINITY_DN601_c0_g5~~TRINITY_DN601_c0_g5_i1.p4  ORF type:complete len:130 (+),score=39.48 TRINITY_DN601_c0_g5_i1:547-936(+)